MTILGLFVLLMADILLWRGYAAWDLMSSNDHEAIAECTGIPQLRCDPTHWRGALYLGIRFLMSSLLLLWFAARLVWPAPAHRADNPSACTQGRAR